MVAGLVALLTGVLRAPPAAPDDARLTFRYAARLATGHGYTFNDHEHVFGASNGLYTFLLAALRWAGVDLDHAAIAIGVVALAVAVGAAAWLARSLAGPLAGWLTATLLLVIVSYWDNAISGMEAGVSSALGLLAVCCARRERDVAAGVLVGLALFNKFDAVLLALALGGASIWVRRRVPWRTAVAAGLTVAPYLVFCATWFHTLIPQSARAKLGGSADDPSYRHFDPFWMLSRIEYALPCAPAAAVATWQARRRSASPDPGARVAVLTLAGWAVLHLAVFSSIDLGAPWPWYVTVTVPPIVVLGTLPAGPWLTRTAQRCWEARTRLLPVGVAEARRSLLVTAVTAGVLVSLGVNTIDSVKLQIEGEKPHLWEHRMEQASTWVRDHGRVTDVVDAQCWGTVPYELLTNPVVDPCRLNGLRPLGPAAWTFRWTAEPTDGRWPAVAGFCAVTSFGRPPENSLVVYHRAGGGPPCRPRA